MSASFKGEGEPRFGGLPGRALKDSKCSFSIKRSCKKRQEIRISFVCSGNKKCFQRNMTSKQNRGTINAVVIYNISLHINNFPFFQFSLHEDFYSIMNHFFAWNPCYLTRPDASIRDDMDLTLCIFYISEGWHFICYCRHKQNSIFESHSIC